MKKLLLLLFVTSLLATTLTAKTINGAGASFPYPVYSQWGYLYNKLTGVKLNYQSIGSGGGIAQIKAKTVDFGASDKPLKSEVLDQFGLVQFPMVMGGVVPVVHLKGVKNGSVKLSASVLADIFLGKIKKWNDSRITALNSGLSLPSKKIIVVHRADGSGTTWIFTNYLSKVSSDWKQRVGNAKAVKWPVGVGGKGNEGVATYVKRMNGSIGYVEFAYALKNKMSAIKLKNRGGKFVAPTISSFQSAAAHADWKNAKGFYMVLTEQPGGESWPITGATYILMHKHQKSASTAHAALTFFNWCYENGKKQAIDLHYIPMPESLISMIRKMWKKEIHADGKAVWK